jgi:hypothetical protein
LLRGTAGIAIRQPGQFGTLCGPVLQFFERDGPGSYKGDNAAAFISRAWPDIRRLFRNIMLPSGLC